MWCVVAVAAAAVTLGVLATALGWWGWLWGWASGVLGMTLLALLLAVALTLGYILFTFTRLVIAARRRGAQEPAPRP